MNQNVEKGKISLIPAIAIVLGNIVGVMIFLTPPQVARLLPSTGWFFSAWIGGGLLALAGALCLGELGAMYPKAGGDYIYIREAYGEKLSFLSGWTSSVITFPGSIAAMAVGLCFFQGPDLLGPWVRHTALTLPLGSYSHTISWAQILALGLIALITGLNHLGARVTGWAQTGIITAPLVIMLVAGVAALFVSAKGAPLPPTSGATSSPGNLFQALVPIFFAYAGWNVTTYIGGEIKDPGRNIPRSLIIGTLLSIAIYVMVLLIFVKAVPVKSMGGVPFLPAVALGRLFGGKAALLFTIVIALAVLGSLNATCLAGGRISYAMSRHGLALRSMGKTSRRFQTPAGALWIQAALAGALVLSGRFDQLVAYTVMVMLLFSTVTIIATIVLRVKRPELARPYKTWGYPVTPLLFALFSVGVIGFLFTRPKTRTEALLGLLITGLGYPVYLLLKRARPKSRGDSAQ